MVLTDWQVLEGDPCNLFSNINLNTSGVGSTISLHTQLPNNLFRIDRNGSCFEAYLDDISSSLSVHPLSCQDKCTDQSCLLLENLAPELHAEESSSQLLCLFSQEQKVSMETVLCRWSSPVIYMQLQLRPPEHWFYQASEDTEPLIPAEVTFSNNCSLNMTRSVKMFPNTSGVLAVFTTESTSPTTLFKQSQSAAAATELCRSTNSKNKPISYSSKQSDIIRLAEKYGVNLKPCFHNYSQNTTNQSICVCQAFSSVQEYRCFWNQYSRITGEFCERCPATCLSETHSLNFVQLIIGLLLYAPGFPIGRLIITLICSDIIGRAPQVGASVVVASMHILMIITSPGIPLKGLLMGLMVASGSFARITGPLWSECCNFAVFHNNVEGSLMWV